MNVLIAEDDPISRRYLEVMLTKWGYEIVLVCNGTEALDSLKGPNPPRLAILDWMMPGMDGIDVCKAVRKHVKSPYIYMILLTARTQKQDIVEGMNAGADDYITKPVDASEMKARLSAANRILNLQNDLLNTREALRKQATHDSLTELPNRLLFGDRLTYCLGQAHRSKAMVAVVFLDLDHFKLVNDNLGHSAGDTLLKEVAIRLTGCLRDVDTIARVGGDEFTIILTGIHSPADVEATAQKILGAFASSFHIEGHELFITPSIGVSLYPSDGTDVETLVKKADAAMYETKEQGRNGYRVYSESSSSEDMKRITLEAGLRKAIEREEFVLHYQPILSISSGRVVGAEALIRWEHSQGMLSPAQFIGIAEETGLIVPIGEMVLHTACNQSKAWHNAGLPLTDVAVNISARQFHQQDLPGMVERALDEAGLAPERLILELTESTLMGDMEAGIKMLRELKSMGVRISLDDFGTGYSSLNYLKRFPIDAVKIDRSFIREIPDNPDDRAITAAIIAMAHSMKLSVIAEGVETLEQLEFLRSLKCDKMQGYFICHPLPVDEFEMYMQRGDSFGADSLRAA